MKRRTIALGLSCMVLLSAFLYFVAIPRVNVTGNGTVTAYPDQADISFSVQTENQSAAEAAAANGAIMTNVYAALFKVDLNTSEITTTSYTLTPTYNSSILLGYVAVNSVDVTVRGAANLPEVGSVIDAIVKAGVNQVDGVSFSFTSLNYDTLRTQAYHKAVQDAYSQASAIVSGLGGVIIGIASVSTNYGYGILPEPMVYSQGSQQTTPINSGPQQVTVTVNVGYLYL